MQTLTPSEAKGYVLARYSAGAYAGSVSIGSNIKQARESAGVKTQSGLAKRVGVPQPQMSDWENDRYTPDLRTLLRIAAAIPCSVDDLVRGLDAQYDAERIRHTASADLTQQKTMQNVTLPVPESVLQDEQTSGFGGSANDTTRDRLSESQTNIVRQLKRITNQIDIANYLDDAAARVRAVADTLRTPQKATAPRAKSPGSAHRHSAVRGTGTARKRR